MEGQVINLRIKWKGNSVHSSEKREEVAADSVNMSRLTGQVFSVLLSFFSDILSQYHRRRRPVGFHNLWISPSGHANGIIPYRPDLHPRNPCP
jgi:hypothetical protein